ncbi:hypothetical protein CBR_g8423 [Chara braunii]|uniref:Chromo domain-containing protein n=1 Tax=Chara braunii TaxID=69332 RepID=A0A388KMF7_CHABU|nr:hypothetical protein CBR_g8423 [Chara braunii]|eukprot:GBG71123.1 hypothetical protein CBR_g8423 [Chara braunii]
MRDVEHSIQLVPNYRVHHRAPYRLSIPKATELKRQLEELLRLGFIKPSNSPWGAPVLFARKTDETLRLCIDYCGLNRYTVKNNYPMPRSDELFDRLAGNRFFTKIDLRSGYHQIHVAAADQSKTTFRSRFGHYEFTVMPSGLTNTPATFQRAMDDIFRDILKHYVLIYLDDILVYSRTLEEHLRHLRDVLDRLRRHGFYDMLSKCHFAQHKVDFLGHYVSDQGLHMDDAKITAIADWPSPTSAKQLRSFLGLTSYYSDCPIAFYSRQLLPAEINYTADEREVLAVVYAARHWRHYLHGAPFMVRTNNSVVQAFLTKPKLTPREARWWCDLSELSFTTEHIKGETNQVADALSRRLDHDQEQIQLSSISVTTVHHSVIDEFRTQYRHCPDYRDIHATLRSGKTVPNYSLGDNGLVSCPARDDWVAHMTSIMKTAHEHIVVSQTRMAARANRSRMDHPFKVGDDVLIDARHLQLEADMLRKFRRRFFGPCRILQTVGFDTTSSPVSFRVKLADYLHQARVHDVYHVSLLRPYRRPSECFAGRQYERPPPIMVDDHEEFLVSDIIGRRVTDDNPPHIEYLVRWKGYPDEEATWEPVEHLQHARMLVRAYDRARHAGFTAPPQPTDPPPSPPAEETAEVEPALSEADLQQQPDASERPQRTCRRLARYDD